MKDSKQVRSEYQSFVESYSSISQQSLEEAYKEKESKKSAKKEEDCECQHEMVLMRKSGAFTELAEKYQMSVKQFARFVENNQGLFDIETRKKAILANKFSGFKESVEWDEFFGDLELKEGPEEYAGGQHPSKHPDKKVRDRYETQRRRAEAPKGVGVPDKSVGYGQLKQSHELEGEELLEVTTKETAAGTKYKVRVKEKESGSSYIRYATREKIAQLRADPKIASVEMTDEGEAPEDKGEKKAQAKGGGLAVKAKKMKEKKEKEAAAPAKPAKRSVTTEGMDPVGQEDADIDNDGDTDKSDEYLHKRRKAIGKAIKGRKGVKKESFSNWREDLKEIVDTQDQKKIKGGKVNNKVVINPPMGEDFDPQKVAEALGAELVDCQNEAVEPDGGGSAPNVPAPVAKFVDDLPKNVKKATKKIKSLVGEQMVPPLAKPQGIDLPFKSVDGLKKGNAPANFPTIDAEKMKRMRSMGLVKNNKPKKTTQVAHFEPEGDQIDEGIPLALGAGAVAAGLAAWKASQGMKTVDKFKKDAEQGKGLAGRLKQRQQMINQMGK